MTRGKVAVTLASLAALPTLCLVAAWWRSLVTHYHLHRMRSDARAFEAMLAGPRSLEAQRALEIFAGTQEGRVRMAAWLLHDGARGNKNLRREGGEDETLLRELEQADTVYFVLVRSTHLGHGAESWGTQVGMARRDGELVEVSLSAPELVFFVGERIDRYPAHRAIWSLIPHASREEISLPELPGLRGSFLPREEALASVEDFAGHDEGDRTELHTLAILLHREAASRR